MSSSRQMDMYRERLGLPYKKTSNYHNHVSTPTFKRRIHTNMTNIERTGTNPRGGGTLIFSHIRRLGLFFWFKILNFNIFGGFEKNVYFLGV